MRYIALTILLAGTAWAQRVMDPAKFPAVARDLRPDQAQSTVPCTLQHTDPHLNFGLRFQTGYVAHVPLNLYSGQALHWHVVFQVTPEDGGRFVLFQDDVRLPPPADPDLNGQSLDANVSGTFLLGEGRYDVKWSLLDDLGRVCRQEWSLEVQPQKAERSAKLTMAPDTASDLSFHAEVAPATASKTAPRRITIFLSSILLPPPGIASTRNSSNQPGPGKLWENLISILEATRERFSDASIRLVVFSLNQNREVFREENFHLTEMNQIAHLAGETERRTVGIGTPQNRVKRWELLANLVKQEIHTNTPSDAVVFLGLPSGSFGAKIPADFPAATGQVPHYFRLQYLPDKPGLNPDVAPNSSALARAGGGHGPETIPELTVGTPPPTDSIADAVHSLKGKTLAIASPDDLENALNTIARESAR